MTTNINLLNKALQMINKPVISPILAHSYAKLSQAEIISNLSDTTKPISFNEMKANGTLEDIKNGFILITNNDVISFTDGKFKGQKVSFYTPLEVKRMLKNSLIVK